MLAGLFVLLLCQLVGEALRQALRLPVPGPVVGMFLLAGALVARDRLKRPPGPLRQGVEEAAGGLISVMGLLFVPAGVGVVTQAALLKTAWLPLTAGLVVSTLLSLVATGLVMRWAGGRRAAA